jgi:hypothetical protein
VNIENKIYALFIFINGKQSELGKISLSANRYKLIDKRGNIINPIEMRPSNSGIIQKIEAAIKGEYFLSNQ